MVYVVGAVCECAACTVVCVAKGIYCKHLLPPVSFRIVMGKITYMPPQRTPVVKRNFKDFRALYSLSLNISNQCIANQYITIPYFEYCFFDRVEPSPGSESLRNYYQSMRRS